MRAYVFSVQFWEMPVLAFYFWVAGALFITLYTHWLTHPDSAHWRTIWRFSLALTVALIWPVFFLVALPRAAYVATKETAKR